MLHLNVLLFSPIQENTYLLHDDEGNCAVIDPGCYSPEERELLSRTITDLKLNPVLLLNTHCHLDHVFGNRYVAETYGLELHIHPLEKQMLDLAPVSGLMWDMPFENYAGPIHHLQPGRNIRLGVEELEVIFTPGHSPGSVSFLSRAQGFVISGDVLFREGVGRTDLPGGNFTTLSDTIIRELYTLPDATVVHSGHGPATTIGWEKTHNRFVCMPG